MKYFDWNEKKNEFLQKQRNISFEEILIAIESACIVYIGNNFNPKKYPKQQVYIVEIRDYAYIIPFIEDDKKIFLKTIISSRKATKKFIKQKYEKKSINK